MLMEAPRALAVFRSLISIPEWISGPVLSSGTMTSFVPVLGTGIGISLGARADELDGVDEPGVPAAAVVEPEEEAPDEPEGGAPDEPATILAILRPWTLVSLMYLMAVLSPFQPYFLFRSTVVAPCNKLYFDTYVHAFVFSDWECKLQVDT